MPRNGVVFVEVGYFDDPSPYVPRDEDGVLWPYEVVHRVIVARPSNPGDGTLSYLLALRADSPAELRTVVVGAAEDTTPPQAIPAPLVQLISVDDKNTRLAVDVERPADGVMAVVERGENVIGAWLPPAWKADRLRANAAFGYVIEGDGPQCVTVRWVDGAGLSSDRSVAGCAEQGGCTCANAVRGQGTTAMFWCFAAMVLGTRQRKRRPSDCATA